MKKVFSIMAILFLSTTVLATTITVKQDGTGDYATIQDAIDAAMPYDTVLVYPDTYYENVIIEDKGLWLASLSLTTGDSTYRNTTIIDGNQNGACVAMITESLNTNVFLHGFTVQNGSGHLPEYENYKFGGGIYVGRDINSAIENCIIKNNNSSYNGGGIALYFDANCIVTDCKIYNNSSDAAGGGICLTLYNTISLCNTSIFQNHARNSGGGLQAGYESVIIFDSTNRCSIYNNYSSKGCDITMGAEFTENKIYLDTLSVLNPERYFIYTQDINGFFIEESVSYDILNGWLDTVDANLFVNPFNGNDSNSGINAQQALKTITYAIRKIALDSLNPNTIHLANGIYSDSINGEKFTIGLRQFVNLKGESIDGTILDGEQQDLIFKSNNKISNYKLSRMTLRKGNHVDYDDHPSDAFSLAYLYWQGDNISLDSIMFSGGWSMGGANHVGAWTGNNLRISNCEFLDNVGGDALAVTGDSIGDTCYINNCIFIGHRPDTNHPNPLCQNATALSLGGSHDAISIATNCLFVNNEDFSYLSLYGSPLTLEVHNNYLVNCTFTGNSKRLGYYTMWMDGVHNSFYNCIIYNNALEPDYIWLSDFETLGKTSLSIYNSLVENGEDAIMLEHSGITVNYDHHTNIDEDPNFLGMWDHPYMIADGSPCINTGTLANLPDFIVLPETDLAGNPRIVGDSIDMGAYEWNETIVGFNEIGPGSREKKEKYLKASPNPFDWGTYIEVKVEVKVETEIETEVKAEVKVEVYDNYGNLVRNILSTNLNEKQEILWYGDDNNGNPLPAGIYHVVMFSGEREVETLKVIRK